MGATNVRAKIAVAKGTIGTNFAQSFRQRIIENIISPTKVSALAFRTIEARAPADDHVSNRRRACVARFALAPVHAQALGKSARLTARVAIAAKGGTGAADC